MLRTLAAVAASFLVVSAGFPQQPEKPVKPAQPTISWYGQSFFMLKTSKGTQVAFDPHAIAEYGRLEGLRADVILMSHKHPDHIQKGVFENADEKGDKAPIIINGWKTGEGDQETWNIFENKQVKDLKITTVGVYHDEVKGLQRGINTVFIVEVDGWRICHLGDLGHKLTASQLKAISPPDRPVDVLMVPVGGIYSLNGSEARVVVAQIKPKEYVFAMHLGTNVYDDLLPIDEFVDENPYPVAVVRDGALIVNKDASRNAAWLKTESVKSDNTIALDRKDARPRPVIVGLHYWPRQKDKSK